MTYTRATLRKLSTPFTWLILFCAFLYFIPSIIMDTVWYDVRSIKISHQENGQLQAEFDRSILRDFSGTYRITIRKQEGHIVCVYSPTQLVQFKKDAALPQPLLLSHIFQGTTNIQPCIRNGFTEGVFYMDICQSVRISPLDIVAARQCFRTNEFTLDSVDQIT